MSNKHIWQKVSESRETQNFSNVKLEAGTSEFTHSKDSLQEKKGESERKKMVLFFSFPKLKTPEKTSLCIIVP